MVRLLPALLSSSSAAIAACAGGLVIAATFADAAPSPSTTTISSSSLAASSSSFTNMSSALQTVLMGSYSSKGAHVVYFTPPSTANGTDGQLELGPSLFLGDRASWIAQHPTEKDVVYAVLEAEPEDGQIVQARLGQDTKSVEVEGTKSTLGAAPAHCAVIANGKALAVANYAGGSVFLQPLEPNGTFSSTPGSLLKFPYENTTTPLRNANRQEASHPHEVVEVIVGGKTEIWVPDLGQDTVWRIEVDEDKAGAVSWKLKEGEHLAGDEGGGPRHIVVGDQGKDLYVLNELLPAVVHSQVYGAKTKFMSKTSVIPPPPASPLTQNTFPSGAELLMLKSTTPHPTLLASTRTLFDRPTDSLAMFDVLPSGELELKQFVYPKGREFRAVGVSQDERFILTGGQEDGWVSVLGQDGEGKWRPVVEPVQVDQPTGVLFL